MATRSSEIYKSRVDRTLFLYVEDGVPFQAVADEHVEIGLTVWVPLAHAIGLTGVPYGIRQDRIAQTHSTQTHST